MGPRGNGRYGKNGNGGNGLTTTIRYKNEQGDWSEQEVATYKGLLSMAHEDGLRRLSTKLIQIPTEANGMTAIAEAEVETVKGVFHAIGDACPGNVNRRIAPHLIRMAETRAKARALRDAVNIGTVALEELGDLGSGEVTEQRTEPQSRPTAAQAPSSQMPKEQGSGQKPAATQATPTNGNGHTLAMDAMTEPQRRCLFRLLAEQGVNGPMAQERLQMIFGVKTLKEVTKSAASVLIDELREGKSVRISVQPVPEGAQNSTRAGNGGGQ